MGDNSLKSGLKVVCMLITLGILYIFFRMITLQLQEDDWIYPFLLWFVGFLTILAIVFNGILWLPWQKYVPFEITVSKKAKGKNNESAFRLLAMLTPEEREILEERLAETSDETSNYAGILDVVSVRR